MSTGFDPENPFFSKFFPARKHLELQRSGAYYSGMAKKAISEDLISSAAAAERIGVSLRRVQVLAAPGKHGQPARLPVALQVGRINLFRRGDVEAFARLKRPRGRPKKGKSS